MVQSKSSVHVLPPPRKMPSQASQASQALQRPPGNGHGKTLDFRAMQDHDLDKILEMC